MAMRPNVAIAKEDIRVGRSFSLSAWVVGRNRPHSGQSVTCGVEEGRGA